MKRLLFLLLLCATSAKAAPAYVQSAVVNFVTSATAPCAYGSNVTLGNLLVVFSNSNSTGITASVADSQGNAWSQKLFQTGPTSDSTTYLWYAVAKATGANTATVTWSSSANLEGAVCAEYSGANTFDQAAIGTETFGSSTATSPSITTTQASEVLVSGFRTNQPPVSVNSPFTQRQAITFSGSTYCVFGDDIVSSTGSYTASATITGSAPGNAGAALIASFYNISSLLGSTRVGPSKFVGPSSLQ